MDDPGGYFSDSDLTGDPSGDVAAAQVNPPDVSNPAINPGLESYLQMLGLPTAGIAGTGGGTTPGAIPTLPTTGSGAIPGYGAPPPGTYPAWLNLGISGQIAQAGAGIPAFGQGPAVNYTTPAAPVKQQSGSGGGGGILGALGGFL